MHIHPTAAIDRCFQPFPVLIACTGLSVARA